MTVENAGLKPIPSDATLPQVRAGAYFEELGAADKRGVSYAEWLRRPRWERAAMVARDRIQARLDFWHGQWAQGKDLPAPQVKPG